MFVAFFKALTRIHLLVRGSVCLMLICVICASVIMVFTEILYGQCDLPSSCNFTITLDLYIL